MNRKEKRRVRFSLMVQQAEIDEKYCRPCEVSSTDCKSSSNKCNGCMHFAELTKIGEALNNVTNYQQQQSKLDDMRLKHPLVKTVTAIEKLFTPEKYIKLLETYSSDEITYMYNIKSSTLVNWQQKHDVVPKQTYTKREEKVDLARKPIKFEERITPEEFLKLRKTISAQEIAKRKGIGHSTLMKWAKEQGLTVKNQPKEVIKKMEVAKIEHSTAETENVDTPQAENDQIQSVNEEITALVKSLKTQLDAALQLADQQKTEIAELHHNHARSIQGLKENLQLSEEIVDQLQVNVKEAENKVDLLRVSKELAEEERDEYRLISAENADKLAALEKKFASQVRQFERYESILFCRIEQYKKAAHVS